MSMSREEMDKVLDDHFRFAADDDLEGVLSTFTEDGVLETIPSPLGGPVNDAAGRRKAYEIAFHAFEKSRGRANSRELRRSYGEDFMVYETEWHGYITDGRPFLCDGKSGEASSRF